MRLVVGQRVRVEVDGAMKSAKIVAVRATVAGVRTDYVRVQVKGETCTRLAGREELR